MNKEILLILFFYLSTSLLNAQKSEAIKEFKPGTIWLDTNVERINAHGGCVIFYEGIYYWYGEHKIRGLSEAEHADGGVHCYASKDLVNWDDMGMMISLDRPENEGLTNECNSDRPKCIMRNSLIQFFSYIFRNSLSQLF